MSAAVTETAGFPVNDSTPVVTYSPVVLEVSGRAVDLEMKVSTPATGDDLPIILFSHGHGAATFLSSLNGYGPLVNFWAAHGFAVIQPTHLDSMALGLREADHREAPLYWRTRVDDMRQILDRLDEIEGVVPGLAGRLDHERIAVAGHSLGGNTASLLLGTRVLDPEDDGDKDLSDPRIKAGVIIAAPGVGDEYLAPFAREHYPAFKYLDFSTMDAPALVIAGDRDINLDFSSRLSYRADAYPCSPAPKSLLTVFGAQHIFGGISGYDTAEATDENPERVAGLRALIWAYLRSQLYPGDTAWDDAVAVLEDESEPLGKVESK